MAVYRNAVAHMGRLCYTFEMRIVRLIVGLLAAFPAAAAAFATCNCVPGERCLCAFNAYTGDVATLIWNVVIYLSYMIGAVATTCFIVGGFMVVLSRGQEPYLPRGKALMIESLIGLSLVIGAQGVLRLVVWVLYADA